LDLDTSNALKELTEKGIHPRWLKDAVGFLGDESKIICDNDLVRDKKVDYSDQLLFCQNDQRTYQANTINFGGSWVTFVNQESAITLKKHTTETPSFIESIKVTSAEIFKKSNYNTGSIQGSINWLPSFRMEIMTNNLAFTFVLGNGYNQINTELYQDSGFY
jgi:hypothetical protein